MVVESWGLGRPDFSTIPARTEPLSSQIPAIISGSVVAPIGVTVVPLYAVPTGYKFIIGYIKTSRAIDSIMGGDFTKNGIAFCPLWAQQMVIDPLPDTSGFVFVAGDVLGFSATNDLDVPVSATLVISGFLYQV
ncbi:MAG: hypothetical protein NT129_06675 [Candidatus Aenigmarchaeota archaeon]|nr:hypothetical protein [Candidatus Aenigmarchaeota archaeon]